MRRFLALAVAGAFFASAPACAKDVTIHGFVTDVKSPTSFAIDDYKITRDSTLVFDWDKSEWDKAESGKSHAPLKPESIRVGTELEVKGEYDEASQELKARSIKVFAEDTRTVKRTALLEKIPTLTKQDSAWAGEVYADGQRISVVPTTVVTLKPNRSERKERANTKEGSEGVPLLSLDALNLDTFIHYEGSRQGDGSIQAQKIEFQHGELENGEAKFWKHFDPKVKDPDYAGFVPGELKMHWKKYRILPSQKAQEYVAQLGESLIPEHQKDLPAGDPLKIPFQFYLVEAKSFNGSAIPTAWWWCIPAFSMFCRTTRNWRSCSRMRFRTLSRSTSGRSTSTTGRN
jgi:hypothetical protein